MARRCSALALLLATVTLGAAASEEPEEGRQEFWADPRGIMFPLQLDDGAPDLVRLGQLREDFERGIGLLDEGNWDAAAPLLDAVAEELPIPDTLLTASVAHYQLEHYAHAQQLLELAVTSAPDDIRITNLLGLVLGALGYPDRALEQLERCLDLARRSQNREYEAYAMLNLAQVQLDLGHPDEAFALARASCDMGRAAHLQNVVAAANNGLGNVAMYRGDYDEAEKLYRRSLQVERRGRGNDDKAAVLNNLASVLTARGRLDRARELLVQAVDEARRRGQRTQEAGVLVTLAALEQRAGDASAAAGYLAQAQEVFEDLALDRGVCEVRLEQARLARAQERPGEALELIERGRLAASGLTLPQLDAELDLLECEILLDQGDAPAARAAADRARHWFGESDQAAQQAGASLCWAEASAAEGSVEPAAEAFARAIEALEGVDDDARDADAHQRYGLFLMRHGRIDEGLAQVERALTWMRREERDREAAITLNLAAYALAEAERDEQALDVIRQAAALTADLGDGELHDLVLSNEINLLIKLGRLEEARAVAGPSVDGALAEQLALAEARVAFDSGLAAIEQQRWERAASAMERVLDLAPAGDRTLRPPAHANLRMIEHHLGLLALEDGDTAAATEHMERALDHLTPDGEPAAEARLLKDLAVVRTELGDQDRAERYLDQALSAAVAAADEDLQRAIQFQMGLARMESDREAARRSFEAAVALDPEASDELAAASRYNLGIVLYQLDDVEGSRAALERARVLYRAMGMDDHVAQIDEYLEEFPP